METQQLQLTQLTKELEVLTCEKGKCEFNRQSLAPKDLLPIHCV